MNKPPHKTSTPLKISRLEDKDKYRAITSMIWKNFQLSNLILLSTHKPNNPKYLAHVMRMCDNTSQAQSTIHMTFNLQSNINQIISYLFFISKTMTKRE